MLADVVAAPAERGKSKQFHVAFLELTFMSAGTGLALVV